MVWFIYAVPNLKVYDFTLTTQRLKAYLWKYMFKSLTPKVRAIVGNIVQTDTDVLYRSNYYIDIGTDLEI